MGDELQRILLVARDEVTAVNAALDLSLPRRVNGGRGLIRFDRGDRRRLEPGVMVGQPGSFSNRSEGALTDEWPIQEEVFSEQIHEVISPEECGELFETLAEWNRYLQEDVPGFGGLER